MSEKDELAMVAIGNDELGDALGDVVQCSVCEGTHPVEYGESVAPDGTRTPSKLLSFFRCGGTTYLSGIKGRSWRPRS